MAGLLIGVVEDDARHARVITDYLERFAAERDLELRTRLFPDGDQLLRSYRPEYDILLLDIQMAGTDGLDTARQIRRRDPSVIIIFITSAPQYAINGYEVSALGYLLKPVPYSSFAQEMSRALESLGRRERRSLTVRDSSGVQRVPMADIVYLESVGHRLDIHLTSRVISLTGTLKEMEPLLVPHGFYRSNSCYIVNLAHVMRVHDQESVMSTGQGLRISRPRKKGFIEALTEHLAGADP
ncbi:MULTISPECIES: LytR/AlgR family response regulator transcription factor [Actinomyces]|uniref:LytR/AlgR family response regulator transcription factor n=1 Tax=Actinomyces TaxID=1654 RepID=UPI001F1A81B5|nr:MULTISPECIES: response regulator [Actinomyces]